MALATAGSFLRKTTITFERYLEEYEKRWNISPRQPTQLPEYESRTLYTTWNLSFESLKQVDNDASQLLTFLAYFDNQHIWHGLLSAGQNRETDQWLLRFAEDDIEFEDAMGQLADYCFVETHLGDRSYSLHSCIHD